MWVIGKWCKFRHSVTSVAWDGAEFVVAAEDLAAPASATPARAFDYVCVCSGHFSVPHCPSARLPGRFRLSSLQPQYQFVACDQPTLRVAFSRLFRIDPERRSA